MPCTRPSRVPFMRQSWMGSSAVAVLLKINAANKRPIAAFCVTLKYDNIAAIVQIVHRRCQAAGKQHAESHWHGVEGGGVYARAGQNETRVRRPAAGLKCAASHKKAFAISDFAMSSLRGGHANLLCIIPIFSDASLVAQRFMRCCRKV